MCSDLEQSFKFECPNCIEPFYGVGNYEEALKDLFDQGIRKVTSKTMEGCFCPECIKNGDLDNVSL